MQKKKQGRGIFEELIFFEYQFLNIKATQRFQKYKKYKL